MQRKNDSYLLESLLKGDEKGIAAIYHQIFPKVEKFVISNKGQKADAEDIFQKALLQLTARIKVREFKIKTTFEGYLFTACKNLWRRELNKTSKNRVTKDDTIELISEERDMSDAILEQERLEFFQEKMQNLSENCKCVLKLYFEQIPYEGIMEKLSYATKTVARQRVFKCKAKLTSLIKSDPRYKNLKSL